MLAVPATVGVPLIVTTLAAHKPLIPAGKLVNVAPVAPVVEYMMGMMGVLTHTFWAMVPGAEVRAIVLFAVTVRAIFILGFMEQSGDGLVAVSPVICRFLPSLARDRPAEVKLAAPDASATMPVTDA